MPSLSCASTRKQHACKNNNKKVCVYCHVEYMRRTKCTNVTARPPHDRTRILQVCKQVCPGCHVVALGHSRHAYGYAGTALWWWWDTSQVWKGVPALPWILTAVWQACKQGDPHCYVAALGTARHWYKEVSQVTAPGYCRHVNRQARVGTWHQWVQMCLCHHTLSWGHGTCAKMPAHVAIGWC